jgi:hypothetical protein
MAVTERVSAEERDRVAEVAERLRVRYPAVPRERVDEVVAQAHRELDTARVRDFVPVLVEKRARDLLRAVEG